MKETMKTQLLTLMLFAWLTARELPLDTPVPDEAMDEVALELCALEERGELELALERMCSR